jgi:hypothetical protein
LTLSLSSEHPNPFTNGTYGIPILTIEKGRFPEIPTVELWVVGIKGIPRVGGDIHFTIYRITPDV